MAKAEVGHVTYKPKGFIMNPEKNPQASVLKYTPKRKTKKKKKRKSSYGWPATID